MVRESPATVENDRSHRDPERRGQAALHCGAVQQDAIRVVGEDEWDRAFDIQADAFSEDPILGHWLVGGRDQADRARRFRRFMGAYAVGASFRDHAEIHMTADGAASAVWLRPPGHFGQPVAEQLRMLPVILALFGRRTPQAVGLLNAMEQQHPSDPPHWYLLGLATRRDRQGQGIGGRLLSFGVARVDAEGMPAYLESSNPRNIGLYARHGFRVTRVLDLPAGAPTATAMWRAQAG